MSNIDYLAITASGEDQVVLVQRFPTRIAEAERRAATPAEIQRVAHWRRALWDWMRQGEAQREQR